MKNSLVILDSLFVHGGYPYGHIRLSIFYPYNISIIYAKSWNTHLFHCFSVVGLHGALVIAHG